MKRLRSTLFLLFLTALGGAYLYWNERGPAVSRGAVVLLRAPQEEVRRVILQPGNVVLEAQTAKKFRVRDQKSGLSAPLDEEAGSALWKQIALVQSSLAVQNPENLRQYDLENPRAWIEVDGQKLEFGAPAPFDKTRIYARGGGNIALVGADLLAKARQPFGEWRERRVMRGAQSAEVFAIGARSDELNFKRDGTQWKLSAPQSLEKSVVADAAAVEAALNALSTSKITRWLDERGENPARYGLGGFRIGFEWNRKRLEIGAKTSGGYAARVLERGEKTPIFEVPAALEAALNRSVNEWRDKRIAIFEIESVERLEIGSGAKSRVLVRDGGDWRAENEGNGQKLNSAALDLLDFVHSLRATDFASDGAALAGLGLDAPVLTLKGTQSGGVVAFELRFGRVGKRLWAQNRARDAVDSIFGLEVSALDATQSARAKIFGPSK